ncbi:ABC transporter substrate-binding protein [Fundicoccus culcitae]|uniref:ABC transporter substrate-binding protein n=1 Tax=Fundicoccus culcitae TaxID=2969821 RepID=A0ABY5P412_9LACT|nr:ABC transporter substrate-binding protein [Fundicoccus culcitae]UUX33340.1 ABC transporter substrate-binding protein [Fundicoccus culcitae]
MKKFKTISIKSLLVILVTLLGVNLLTTSIQVHATDTEEITITDMAGREIVLEGPATRIVVLQPSNAEILFSLGAGDVIIGRGEYVDYPTEEVEDIPQFATGENMNLEEIIALNPEVVITTTMNQSEDQMSQLEETGIKVITTDASTIEEVYDSIELLGLIVGYEEEANLLIEDMQNTFEEYSQKADEGNKENLSIYYEISPLEFGLWTGGQNTFMDEIGQMLNLENVFSEVDGWAEISEEQVLEKNPDYIITTTMPFEGSNPVEEILGRNGWDAISAIESGNVFQANSDEFTRPGPRLMDAIITLYEFVYGE